jgi:hypothetical protein
MTAAAHLRRTIASTILFTLLVGIAGGVTMAAIAGARRSSTAFDRFIAHTTVNTASVYIDPSLTCGQRDTAAPQLDRLRSLPYVASVVSGAAVIAALPDPTSASGWRQNIAFASVDADLQRVFGRPIIVHGHLPAADRSNEIALNEEAATRRHLHLGSVVRLGVFTSAQLTDASNGAPIQPEAGARKVRVLQADSPHHTRP